MGRFAELYYPEHLKGDLDKIRDLGYLTGEPDDLRNLDNHTSALDEHSFPECPMSKLDDS